MAIQFTAHIKVERSIKSIWYGNTQVEGTQEEGNIKLPDLISWTQVKEDDRTGKKAIALTKDMEPKAYSIRVVLHQRVLKFLEPYSLECKNWIYIETSQFKKKS